MIITEKKYEEADYKDLVRELLVAPDLDAEFQFPHFKSVLIHNRRFFLLLFKALDEVKSKAILFDDEKLHNAINRLEGKLYEYTNVIPAKIPDSILNDRILVGQYLADQHRILYNNEEWKKVTNYIIEKFNTIPTVQQRPFLEWCLKMLQMNAERHKKKCKKIDCGTDQGYDLRLNFIERMIEDATPKAIEPQLINMTADAQTEKPTNKIQWLGSQKELAELFVELQKKGWIEKFENETIQDCFTESKSVPQYLKPGTDTKTGEQTFENLYNGYVPQFMNMRENPKRRK
jgi:hypothetical protein